MNRAKWSTRVILVLVGWILTGFFFSGCASKKVMINNYTPALSKDFAALKGQKICLLYFQNHAQDATRSYYYSKDKQTGYEEFRQMSERQPLEWKMRLVSEKGLRDFLENYVITREILYQEAKKRNFDSKKEIVMKVEDF